ncbi:hypothetical protein BN946_scf184298.g22 [Trametes cinnabarina]|uniref:DNA polymerase eta n=1 Tax=Pycnoporus cinnabarinus TaxID=5643 RepID=A0A060SRI8_PYCCI|nr:hypothetical protein BN946_scf184298.g22 [Trametes cinnabarina]
MDALGSGSVTNPQSNTTHWKAKASEDFNDLTPTITYRHLLFNNLGSRDPLRVIALCDSDAFYAACEQVRLGIDPALPLVVQQWDSLIAVNYPARKFGISRMDKIRDAKKRCPNLVVVHVATYKEGDAEPGYWENPDTLTHKVSLDHYRRESMKIIQMFKEGLPTGEIEKASIDEAFIDFTRPVREEILKRYPYLGTVPPDAPNGIDSPLPPPPPISWDGKGTIVPIHSLTNPPKAQDSPADGAENEASGARRGSSLTPGQDDGGVDDSDDSTTWHDVALSIAAELMLRIREDIRDKLGYTTSALTASYKKPMNQIRFLGGKLGKALAEEYDVSTVGDLLTISLDEMQRKFGEDSIWVYEILRGIDRSEVKEKPVVTKSMLASKNLPQPITKATQGYHWIRVLAAELALRLNEAREGNLALWPKTIVLHIRQGYETFRSKQSAFPFTRNVTVDVIAGFGEKLWRELVGTGGSTPFKITNVQLSFSGIGTMESGQRTIEGFLASRPSTKVQLDLGPEAASASKCPSTSKRKRSSSHVENSHESATLQELPLQNSDDTKTERDARFSFICDKCRQRIWLKLGDAGGARDANASTVAGADGGQELSVVLDDAIREDALATLRLEHADFHYAQKLAASVDESIPRRVIRPVNGVASTAKKKRKTTDEGIARFFSKK